MGRPTDWTKRQQVIGLMTFVLLFLQLCAVLSAQEPKKVRMAYSAFSISFLNIFVARDAGLFKKHGLEVELIQMAGPLPVAALAAGEIDYLTGYTTGIVATGQGAPLKGIMISLRKPPFFSRRRAEYSAAERTARLQPKTDFRADQRCRGDGLFFARSSFGGKIEIVF